MADGRQRGRRRAVAAAVGAVVVLALVAVAAALGVLPGTGAPPLAGPAAPATTTAASPDPSPTRTPRPTPSRPPEVPELTLVAAGDVLLHQPVLASARTPDGGYDLGPLLEPVRPWVERADLALCHLEVPIAPPGTAPSGYPLFGAPADVVPSLADQGWDGCSTASNHSLDRGAAGVTATLDALDAAGLGHVGTARTAVEAAAPQLYELERAGRTLRVAHLAGTYGTNGMPLPASAPWAVTLLDTDDLVERAAAARQAGADVVVVSVHCCVEYVSDPTAEQERIAAELAASGVVDLLIGHHAHVPQPIELLPGGPRGDGLWVAHGLGNFVSNQGAHCCSERTASGLLLTATVRAPVGEPASVTDVGWTAVTMDLEGGHRVLPLSAMLGPGAATPTLGTDELRARHALVAEVVGPDAAELRTPRRGSGPAPVVVPRPRDG